MSQLVKRLQNLRFDADLQVDHAGRRARVTAKSEEVNVEVPDVATGLVLCWFALPRGLLTRILDGIRTLGISARLTVRGRPVVQSAGNRLRLRPVGLLLAILGF